MMRNGIVVVVLLGVALAGWKPVGAQVGPALSILGDARPGLPLYVTVRGVISGTTGEVRWDNKKFDLSPAGPDGVMRSVLPVPLDMPLGQRPMIVELSDGTHLDRAVDVKDRWYPSQSIWLSADTLANYDTPQNKADDERILEVMQKFDATKRWSGNFGMPVVARESTAFGVKRLYNGWRHGRHAGLDLAAAEGTPIKASAAGVVLLAEKGLVNGNTVVLSHGLGLGTVYLHMSRINVKAGEEVDKGDVVGWVGGTGGFAPHLHWETRAHGIPVDPHSLLSIPKEWR